jgi:uncharacterized protein (DUF427 family)
MPTKGTLGEKTKNIIWKYTQAKNNFSNIMSKRI